MSELRGQELMFFLTPVFIVDEKTGDITAFFAQFPEVASQGRDKEEAQKLLFELFPHMLNDRKEEFFTKFHLTHPASPVTYDLTMANK